VDQRPTRRYSQRYHLASAAGVPDRQASRGIFYSSNIADNAQRHRWRTSTTVPVFVDAHTSINICQPFKINSKGWSFESSRGSKSRASSSFGQDHACIPHSNGELKEPRVGRPPLSFGTFGKILFIEQPRGQIQARAKFRDS
jgi:hypothetical protein